MRTQRFFGKLQRFHRSPLDSTSGVITFLGTDNHPHTFSCDWVPIVTAFIDMFGGSRKDAVKTAQGMTFEYTVRRGRMETLFPITDETR